MKKLSEKDVKIYMDRGLSRHAAEHAAAIKAKRQGKKKERK